MDDLVRGTKFSGESGPGPENFTVAERDSGKFSANVSVILSGKISAKIFRKFLRKISRDSFREYFRKSFRKTFREMFVHCRCMGIALAFCAKNNGVFVVLQMYTTYLIFHFPVSEA